MKGRFEYYSTEQFIRDFLTDAAFHGVYLTREGEPLTRINISELMDEFNKKIGVNDEG
jgi:hypothetical protein